MSLVFIGGGNMAAAMIGGLKKQTPLRTIHVIERDPARRQQLAATFGVTVAPDPDATVAQADVIVLAVKPNDLRAVCETLRPLLAQTAQAPVLLSVAAGIPSHCLVAWSGTESVVRAMPNTPALVGKGMTGLFARPEVSLAQRTLAQDVIAATGQTLWLDTEDQIDAVTAISGSGPAYVFYFMEAMQTAAVELGLTPDEGRRLTLQTFIGAAELAAQSSDPVAVLRERVTSKGGTTAAALASMAAQHLPEIIRQAARAAHGRSRDMAKEFGQP